MTRRTDRPRTLSIEFTRDEAVTMAYGYTFPRQIRAKFLTALRVPECRETEWEDTDPTDAETGGLAASWASSRASVAAHPDYTDGLD